VTVDLQPRATRHYTPIGPSVGPIHFTSLAFSELGRFLHYCSCQKARVTPVPQLLLNVFIAAISKLNYFDFNRFLHWLKHNKCFILLMNFFELMQAKLRYV